MDAIDKINQLLFHKGMSGAELSRLIGVSNSVYSQWNTRTTKPSKQSLLKVASALGVPAEELLPDKKETPTEISLDERLPGYDDLSEENKLRAREYVELLLKSQQI